MADDYSSDTSRTGTLAIGSQVTGNWEDYYDGDWFKVGLTAGQSYTFTLSGAAGFSAIDEKLSVFNQSAQEVKFVMGASGASQVTLNFTADTTGTYYVAARDVRFYNFSAIGYTLKASAAATDAVGDTRATAAALVLGQAVQGTFETGTDIDYYKVALQAGKTYAVTPLWNTGNASNNGSYTARVEDASGKALSTMPGSAGIASGQSFTVGAAGDYYISARTQSTLATAYTLTLTEVADDYSAAPAGAGALTVGASTSGTLNVPLDKDWYGISMTAGTTYWITLGGDGLTSTTTSFQLVDASGAVIATRSGSVNTGSTTAMLLPYTPTESGTYYAEVADLNGKTGNYTVTAALGEPDEAGSTSATAAALAPGVLQQGRVGYSTDVDVYKVAVQKGVTYLVELASPDTGGNARLSLQGSTGNTYSSDGIITFNKPELGAYKMYTPTYTGDYYLAVASATQYSPVNYTLKISTPADDFAASQQTSAEVAVGGKMTGKLDYTGDLDWIKVTLQYGAKYAFLLRGAGSGEGTLLLDTGSLQLPANQPSKGYMDGMGDGIFTLSSQSGGDYYLQVRGWGTLGGSGPGDGTGSYTLYAVALNGDTTAPKVTAHSPADNAGMYDNIVVQFDEAIMRGTSGAITLRNSQGVAVESFSGTSDSRIAISNGTLTLNPSAKLTPGTQYLLDIGAGNITDLAGNKYAGGQLLAINTKPTVTAGTDANDFMTGLGNGVTLNGGTGVDTVIYGAARGNYQVSRTDSATQVLSKSMASGTAGDTLSGVERLMFSDTNVALDIAGTGGMAYRLYQAAFNRTPEKTGVGYWIDQMDKGASLHSVAQSFIDSAEFKTRYGATPADALFIDKLYQNVLHRAGEQSGVAYWNKVLADGGSRADVLAYFSESPENQAAVLKVIGNGFDYTPYG